MTTMSRTHVGDSSLVVVAHQDAGHAQISVHDTQGMQMKIRIDQYPTLQIFRLAKLSFAKRFFKIRPEIIPSINNWLEIFRYDLNKETIIHRDILNSYQKAFREVGWKQLGEARKNFNNVAGECEITPRICDILVGHSPDSRLNMMSYTDYTTSEYARQIDEAHTKVLKRFRVSELADALQDKLEELSLVKSKKI